jgi:hypothetical protein
MQLNKKINNEEMKLAPVLIVLTLFLALFLIPSQMLQKEPEFAKKLPLRVHEGFQEKLAPASLDKPREAYNALNDWLPEATAKYSAIKSGCCYETSFQSRIEKVGSYKQMTNNFKHAYPDTCSIPFKELLMTFYKPQTLNSSL